MASGNPAIFPRVFLDSGVFLEGLLAPWSASRAVLVLSRRRVFKIILAKYVQGEVEENLLELLATDARLGNEIINVYATLLRLLDPEYVALPSKQEVERHRHLIRHQADVPVLGLSHQGCSRLVPDHQHAPLQQTSRPAHPAKNLHTARLCQRNQSAGLSRHRCFQSISHR